MSSVDIIRGINNEASGNNESSKEKKGMRTKRAKSKGDRK